MITGGALGVVDGADTVRQMLDLRLSIWQGEWFADTAIGVPYRSFLGVKGAERIAEAQLRRAIATCPGVASLRSFTFAVDERRRAACSFEVTTITGEPLSVSGYIAGGA